MSPPDGGFTPPFIRAATDDVFPGPRYRVQDEYLEWVMRKDGDGVITEVLFTCEGPEYWDTIATDRMLLVELYKEIVGDNNVKVEDLVFPEAVRWRDPNNGLQRFVRASAHLEWTAPPCT